MNIDKEREAFEAKHPIPKGIAWIDGRYQLIDDIQPLWLDVYLSKWEAWKSSAALDEQKAGPSDVDILELWSGDPTHSRPVIGKNKILLFARALLSKYAAPAPKGKPVAIVRRYGNNIRLERPDGEPFDVSEHVGRSFYAAPVNDQDGGQAKEDIYEEVYDNLCSILKPHIDAQKLPPSVTEAVESLVRQWASTTNEQDAKDSARYRAFRAAMAKSDFGFFFRIEEALKLIGVPESIAPNEEQIDVAFDAAIAQQGKEAAACNE